MKPWPINPTPIRRRPLWLEAPAPLPQRRQSVKAAGKFDTGNCLRNGDDPVASARLLGRHIVATHTKDVMPQRAWDPKDWMFFACTPVGKGLIDFPALVTELEKLGYDGLPAAADVPHPENPVERVADQQHPHRRAVPRRAARDADRALEHPADHQPLPDAAPAGPAPGEGAPAAHSSA
jgi:hypothetical protein